MLARMKERFKNGKAISTWEKKRRKCYEIRIGYGGGGKGKRGGTRTNMEKRQGTLGKGKREKNKKIEIQ